MSSVLAVAIRVQSALICFGIGRLPSSGRKGEEWGKRKPTV